MAAAIYPWRMNRMDDLSDMDLLANFAREADEQAFAALVHRHLNLVYSAALRQVFSPELAEEVAQSVFVELASRAASLRKSTVLSAWLYEVARCKSVDVIRRESRRQSREKTAIELNAMHGSSENWEDVRLVLDEAMQSLDERERAAILLRFFENRPLREVGAALGVSADTAQKRVARALDHLRAIFAKQGLGVSATGLAGLISAHSVQAAPAGLALALATACPAAVSASVIPQTIVMTTIQKSMVGAALVASLCTALYQTNRASSLGARLRDLEAGHARVQGELARTTEANSRLAIELAEAKQAASHLPALRAEVARLRLRANELAQAHTPPAAEPEPAPTAPVVYPRAGWRHEGFATPEAALKSFMFAKSQGDIRTVLTTGTPELNKEVESTFFAGRTPEECRAILLENVKDVSDVAILNRMSLAEDQTILQTHFGGAPSNTYSVITMVKLGDEWKVSSVEERTQE